MYRAVRRNGRVRRSLGAVALVAGVAFAIAGCSSSASAGPASSATKAAKGPPASIPHGSGDVNVLYAGSLVSLMENQVSPAFHDATGYTFKGYGAGSQALAADIKGKVKQADVFISASPTVNAGLEGSSNGDWVSWYATFANSPLVIGYNPNSSFVKQLKSKPWYDVVTESGFKLGSTDPQTDPKGALAAQALKDQGMKQGDSALTALATSNPNIQTEESMVGQLQAGQLDAGFFYASEAKAANIPTVPLKGESLKAVYTITVVNNAPDASGAAAFVAYLLGKGGQGILKKNAYDLTTPPEVSGSGVPKTLKSVLGR